MQEKRNTPFRNRRLLEKGVAVASFLVAIVFAFASLYLADYHEVAAGNCTVIAQFLLLTASLFGIDYKLNSYGSTNTKGTSQQQSAEYSQGQ